MRSIKLRTVHTLPSQQRLRLLVHDVMENDISEEPKTTVGLWLYRSIFDLAVSCAATVVDRLGWMDFCLTVTRPFAFFIVSRYTYYKCNISTWN